jgi:putative transposase
MITHRVEQHLMKKNDNKYNIIDNLCFKSKNVYNYANYIVRQEFIKNKKWVRYNELANTIKDSEPYRELGSNVGQQTLKILDKNWVSFFKSNKEWNNNKEKYLGRPKLPGYKDKEKGRNVLVIDNIKCSIKDGYLRFSWKPLQPLNNRFKTNIIGKLMQVRFVPKNKSYVIEIVYEVDVPEAKETSNKIIGIDIGIDNLATVGNNIGLQPFIINGKPLKSMNQYYNKIKAEKQSDLKKRHDQNWSNRLQGLTDKRNNKVNDYIHKSSKHIIDWCKQNEIDTIVIGKNKNWKQESEMSKKVNQNFVGIPHDLFIKKIKYKAENNGIKVIETEESYTSGTSFLDGETPCKENYNKSRRIHRGLFKTNKGVMINADLNGAYQIIKKVFPDAFANGIEGVDLHPVRVNIV